MRNVLRGAAVLAVTGMVGLAAVPAWAQAPERELLGVKIWRSWKDVLQKHGQPTRIEVGAVSGGGAAAGGAGGGMMGGGGGGAAGPGGASSKMGAMMGGGGGLPGLGGSSSGGGAAMGNQMRSMMTGRMGGGMSMPPGAMGGPGGPTGGGLGLGLGNPMSGMMGMMGGGGMGAGGGGGAASSDGEGEVTWVYERGASTYNFLFNKDGRIIQIQSFGYSGAGNTSRGVKLGDATDKVYKAYQWPDSLSKTADTLTLDYSSKAQVAFQLANRKDGKGLRVVGITVALTDGAKIRMTGPGGTGMGSGFGASGGMGGPGAVGGEGLDGK